MKIYSKNWQEISVNHLSDKQIILKNNEFTQPIGNNNRNQNEQRQKKTFSKKLNNEQIL